MSTKRKKPPLRNFKVLLARAAAEVRPGTNIAHVKAKFTEEYLIDFNGTKAAIRRLCQMERHEHQNVSDRNFSRHFP